MAECKRLDHELVFQSVDETKEIYRCSICGEKETYSKCAECGKYVFTLFERGLCSECLSKPTSPKPVQDKIDVDGHRRCVCDVGRACEHCNSVIRQTKQQFEGKAEGR